MNKIREKQVAAVTAGAGSSARSMSAATSRLSAASSGLASPHIMSTVMDNEEKYVNTQELNLLVPQAPNSGK